MCFRRKKPKKNHDFQVLQLVHPEEMIRDTAEYEPFKAAFRGKTQSLKNLSKKLLGIKVQIGEHSLVQDSQAAVRIYMMHCQEWEDARMEGWQIATNKKSKEVKVVNNNLGVKEKNKQK